MWLFVSFGTPQCSALVLCRLLCEFVLCKLNMADDDLEDFQPLRKKPKFKAPLADDEMATVSKGFVPPNTRKNTTWAVKVFSEWKAERNKNAGGSRSLCPDSLLERPDPAQINTWLSRFVTEARKQNGEPYPPRTMHQILAGLQCHMLEITPNAAKFLDTNNTAFRELQGTCDTIYRKLHSQGVGTTVKHTATFTAEEEENYGQLARYLS